ncbi:MAG: tetratricopeptide repeat protein, partial [Chitinispirillia bacterium]|nr:tetratricopeptide repeat protein [Chitinispirillia bacterium]
MRKLFSVVFAAALGALVFAAAVNGQENRGRQNAGQQDTGEYIHYRLAMQYKSEKKYDLAISEFRKVLAAYPDHYHTYMHLAEIRRDQGNHKLVIYNLQKALSYNPGWGRAQKMLADAFAADGQPERAIAEFQAYQNVCDPIERDSIQTVIDGLMRRMRGVPSPQQAASKDTAAAVPAPAAPAPAPAAAPRAAAASVRLNPQAEEAMKRVIALYNEKKYDEMLTAVRAVLAIQSNHPGAYYYAGLVRRMNKQVNMAKINFNKALTHPHYGGTAHFHLGAISVEENNRDGAVRHLRAALASKSDQFDREEARRLLESLGVAVDANQPADTAAAAQTTAAADRVISIDKYAPIEIRIDSMLSMMTVDTLSDVGQKLLTGIRSFKENRFDEAILEFRRVLADNPNGPIAAHCLYNIGVCYFKLRLFNDAENQFQLFLNRFPTHRFAPQAFFFRA